MKVEIVEWKSYCTWHWDLASSDGYVDELCGICRVSYDGTCPNCKYPEISVLLCWGQVVHTISTCIAY